MKFNLEQFKQGVKAETRDGFIATFVGICEDCIEYNRVVGHVEGNRSIIAFSVDGRYLKDAVHNYDLVSMVSPWKDVPIDTKVRVKWFEDNKWSNRHYAGLRDGKPTAWCDGETSWTTCGRMAARATWDFMELVED